MQWKSARFTDKLASKTLCNDTCLLTTIDLLEVELASRAQEDEEERRKQKNANVAVASFTSSTGSTKTSTKPVCRNFITENGCNKGGQCTFLHPATVGRCLRCGSTKHAVAECKRPRKDSGGTSSAKGKGKDKSPPLPKSSSPSTSAAKAKPKADAKKRPGPKPKAKGKAKPKASAASSSSQAMHCLMWAEDQTQEHGESLSTAEILPSASLASHHDADYFSACTFYTTFTPAFHTTEPTDADGILPPILDTGATHCLLPLKWMTHEQAESCKKIHLKVASGATVRALLHENVIYCSTVSGPLVSVGQLKGMLDLRMIWDDSSPKIIACSGGLRYILIEAAVFHNLPVITHQELQALLGAIHDFTQTGTLYNAATWSKRLGRKLSLFHWSSPTATLPQDHADFTEDPQVNFTSVCNSSPLRVPGLPSTVQIVDLELDNPMTDDETTTTGDCNKAASLPCQQSVLPCEQADALPCLHGLPCSHGPAAAAMESSPADEALEAAKSTLLNHVLPKARQRTNVFKDVYQPRGRLFGAFTTRGVGITQATFRFPEIVSAIHLLASSRPSGFTTEPYMSAQLNASSSLPLHKDKNNFARSWVIGLGSYEGGRLWIEDPLGNEPPPCISADWQKGLRGCYHDIRHRWVQFDPQLYHCVEPVSKGERRSVALFTPRSWKRIPAHCLDELIELGFLPSSFGSSGGSCGNRAASSRFLYSSPVFGCAYIG